MLFAVTALGYFALARYVIWLNDPSQVGAGFWPAGGLTVGLLLRAPSRLWPWAIAGVVAGESASNLIQGYPHEGIPWWVAGNVLGPLIGAALVRRFASPSGALTPLRNLFAFIVFAVALGPLIGATVGSIGTVGFVQSRSWFDVWPKYVVGDALGVFVVAPVMLTYGRSVFRRRAGEALALLASLVLVSATVFQDWPHSLELISVSFTLPFLTWAAVRFGMKGAAWAVFLLAQIANLENALGNGPFADLATSRDDAVTALQIFLLVAASSTFVLAALVDELSDRERVDRLIRDLADAMPQLVWVVGDAGEIAYFNQRRDAYFQPADVGWGEGRGFLHPDDRDQSQAEWRRALESGGVYQVEHRMRMADGSYRWHLSRAERLDAIGRLAWYGTSTDIHELKLAEQAKDQFIAIASHELRNPVAALHGTAQQLRRAHERDTLTPERLEAYTRSLVSSSSYLARLTHELMDVSRLQVGGLPAHPEPTDLEALIHGVASSGEWPAHRIRLELAEGLGEFMVDPARAHQLLSNLIDNGVKYSPESLPVVVRAGAVDGGIAIDVIDQGIGVPPGERERIFTPFGRAENVGTVPGLGMGLYLAREIAEQHRGRLEVVGDGEPGTTIRFWLPADARAPRRATSTDPRDGHPVAGPGGEHVLGVVRSQGTPS